MFFERIDPDALDGFVVSVQGIELAAALGVAEILPVGRSVAGAGEARLLDEGLQQHGAIGVAGVPVLDQASTDQGEHTRGEVLHADPGQDKEAGIVHDEVQMTLTLLAGPADELIARFHFPGTRAEAQCGDDLVVAAHEVAQLGAWHRLIFEIVVTFDVGIPQQGVGLLEIGSRSIRAKSMRGVLFGSRTARSISGWGLKATGLAFLGGGNRIRPSACMRSSATRQLMSFSRPLARHQFSRSHSSRESRARLIRGCCSN